MATPKQIKFQFKELATLLARAAAVHEGHWGLYVRFGLAASNIGPTEDDLRPAAIVPIVELGIQEFDAPNSLTVDAAALDSKAGEPGTGSEAKKDT